MAVFLQLLSGVSTGTSHLVQRYMTETAPLVHSTVKNLLTTGDTE